MNSKEALESLEKKYHNLVIRYYYETNITKEYRSKLYDDIDEEVKIIKASIEAGAKQ